MLNSFQMKCSGFNFGSGTFQSDNTRDSGLTLFTIYSIENTSLIVAATIPTLRPLLTRQKATRTPYKGNGPSDYYRNQSRSWRFPKNSMGAALPSVDSDHLELTDQPSGPETNGTDTYYKGNSELSDASDNGTMRRVETRVAY